MPWDLWLIFFLLGVVVPWRGRIRLGELLAKPRVSSAERISLYVSSIAFQWIAAAVVAWRAWAHRFHAGELGLVAKDRWKVTAVAILGAAVIGALHWLNLRRMGRPSARVPEVLKTLAEQILPQSSAELPWFIALAFTAGLCEEFIYRGFAMAAFVRVGLPGWGVVLASAALFGLAHLYQGRGGLLGTMILGALFAAIRIVYDSLVPAILWHIAVDLVAGVAGPRFLARRPLSTGESVT
jgi:uncharacterized protein